ncbi:MAG: pitrilysin family protein [Planctomycetota bacterium]
MAYPFTTAQLSNGLRVMIEHMPEVKTTAAGFLVRTGARDEHRVQAGVSHFLEHMCFKGTEKRTAYQLNVDFDVLGGHPNAFTSQDRTFYYGVVRSADIDAQIELLADMMRSALPPHEFDTEKNVVLEEIAMSADHLEHVAFDFILEQVFAGHALGWPVLGYQETLRNLTREHMYAYFRERYVPANMVLIAAGSAAPETILEAAERHCGAWVPHRAVNQRSAPQVRTGIAVKCVERFKQQLVAICFPAPAATDPLHETAQAVAAILGGDNSRFYWNIMQTGLSPQAGAWPLDYADNGLLILSAQGEPEKAEKLVEAMCAEAAAISRHQVEQREIDRVKNRRRTSLAVEGESPYYRLVQIMDDTDYRGQPRTVEERLAAVARVGYDSIREYFERYPIDGEGYLVSVGPRAYPPVN